MANTEFTPPNKIYLWVEREDELGEKKEEVLFGPFPPDGMKCWEYTFNNVGTSKLTVELGDL